MPGKTPPDPSRIQELTEQVAKQGNCVRQLKASGSDRARIDSEVGKLLALKRELALAQNMSPDGPRGKGKK